MKYKECNTIRRTCRWCRGDFYPLITDVKRGKANYCSDSCKKASKSANLKSHHWSVIARKKKLSISEMLQILNEDEIETMDNKSNSTKNRRF